MVPIYISRPSYTIVITPHFQEQIEKRENLLPATFVLENCFDKLWKSAPDNITFGCFIGAGLIYGKKKWNSLRERWELEFLTFTPRQLHTKNKKFAVALYL